MRKETLLSIGGTMIAAAGLTFTMQYLSGSQSPSFDGVRDSFAKLDLSEVQFTSTQGEQSFVDEYNQALVAQTFSEANACEVHVDAISASAAMVELHVKAPCQPNELVTIHHNGLMFNGQTDLKGHYQAMVPALNQNAVFIASFENGEGAFGETIVEKLEEFNRVALQWKGDLGIQLHAYENGAGYNEEGHVWAQAPRSPMVALSQLGGFITELGEDVQERSLKTHIYSAPKSLFKNPDCVEFSVEVDVLSSNCSKHLVAQSIELQDISDIKSHDIRFSMPGCDAIGDYIMLKNVVSQLLVASNE